MTAYELIKTPNQDFSIVSNGNTFLIRLRTFRGIVYADCRVNDILVNAAMRCVPNRSIFTSEVNNAAGGTFMFKCVTDDYPDYENYNTQNCKFVLVPFGE